MPVEEAGEVPVEPVDEAGGKKAAKGLGGGVVVVSVLVEVDEGGAPERLRIIAIMPRRDSGFSNI